MEKPVIIARYPESISQEVIHGFAHKVKNGDISSDYHFLFFPTKKDEFNFEILSVKDINELTIEDLQKKLFELAEDV